MWSHKAIKKTNNQTPNLRLKHPLILTYKTAFYPTQEQERILWDLAEKCRLLYNFALTERIINWRKEKDRPKQKRRYITYRDQQNALPSLKARYPEYKWVYSKVLQMVLKTLDADYRSFFRLWSKGDVTARPPRYKSKKTFTTLKYNQSGFQVHNGVLTLSHKHPASVPLAFVLPYLPAGTVKQVEIYQAARTKQWFVSFNCHVKTLDYYDNGLYQAFDLGIDNIVSAVNSQGRYLQIKNRRPDKYWRPKIAEVMAKRDRCKKYSPRWHWYNNKLYRMVKKLANQLRDFQHWLSKKIVHHTKANTLIVGKPTVKKMASHNNHPSSPTLRHSLQNTGSMSHFVELVAYKAARVGKRVIPINEAYTTQICPQCGDSSKRPLSDRTIACSNCGHLLDRDLSASINILAKFYLQKDQFPDLLHEPSVNEELFLTTWKGFLRHTANGKTKVPMFNVWTRFGGLAGSHIR